MTYGGAETVTILINPDGTLDVKLNDFAERDAQPEIDELVNALRAKGLNPVVSNQKVEYTGEYHKHTHSHSHELHDHH
jgi:hypothetical protein